MMVSRRFQPSLTALRALEALDRLGSATAAASELNLSQSAISRQLHGLEDQVGVPLVLRQGRGVVPTQAARSYAAEIRGALGTISQATLRLTINPGGGTLNLAILPTFGMRWLVPRLPDFARTHPEVTVNLATRLQPFNFAVEPFDAAIHFGKSDWPGTDALLLRQESVVAVCTPALIEQRPPRRPEDLLDLPLLRIATRPDAWAEWFAVQGVTQGRITGTMHDQFATITQAARHGMGVALLPDYLAEEDLATGRLVMAWGAPTPSAGAYWLVWPEGKARDAALSKFRDWLSDEAAPEDLLPR